MKMKSRLPDLTCPKCQKKMLIRVMSGDHINKKTKKLKKQRYYQYYCEDCDDENTGWTSTQSDTLSLKLKRLTPPHSRGIEVSKAVPGE